MLHCINTANSVIFHSSRKIKQKNYGIRNLMTKCKHTVMTPISSILPGVSWRLANWIATWWYMGSNFSWRAASFFEALPSRLESVVDWSVSLQSGYMPYPVAA